MRNFLCLKGRIEFLWRIHMQAHHEYERPWVSEWLILKSYFFMHIYKHFKTYLPHFYFQFNSVPLKNMEIPSSHINSYVWRITEPTFESEVSISEKFQFHI